MTPPTTEIRLIDPDDADALTVHRVRDAEAFVQWEPAQPDDFFTLEGQRRRIDQLLTDHSDGSRWPGAVLADGEVIGQMTVSTIIRGPFRKGFLGYWIATTHHGKGHASRAVGLVLRVMADDLGLHRAEAHTQVDNLPSQVALGKNGFRSWGIAHDHIYMQGAWRDEIFWERTLER
ncbi:MAG TPA: GNAT family protein [Nocardioidaceae bacterium]|nr:GNAT family protein [Nocardioidaceae bacterium]